MWKLNNTWMSNVLTLGCASLEFDGLTSEAATITRLISEDHDRTSCYSTFSEDRDEVTLLHTDLWSGNMMFRVRNDHGDDDDLGFRVSQPSSHVAPMGHKM